MLTPSSSLLLLLLPQQILHTARRHWSSPSNLLLRLPCSHFASVSQPFSLTSKRFFHMPTPIVKEAVPVTSHATGSKDASDLDQYDPEQVRLMEEMCIVVDPNDRILGYDTKFNTHRWEKIVETQLLHRAFSVFLFNERGELLLQRRSNEKITFPGYWTNTCCSHPLFVDSEQEGVAGCRRAGLRKLVHELGVHDAPPLEYLTRIHYQAASDTTWGEHEIDYIFFGQGKFCVQPQPNEVLDVQYVDEEKLKALLKSAETHTNDLKITPWFKMICETFLFEWWAHLRKGTLATCVQPEKIFKLSPKS